MDCCVIVFLSAVGFFSHFTSLVLPVLYSSCHFVGRVRFQFFFGFSLVLCGPQYQYGGGFSS
jgi:hypothetical protein